MHRVRAGRGRRAGLVDRVSFVCGGSGRPWRRSDERERNADRYRTGCVWRSGM